MTAAARARVLADVGRLGEAEQAVRAGLAGVPDDPELLSLLACLLRLQGRRADALAAAEAAVAAAPHAAVPRIERAECLLLLPEHADAGLSGGFRRGSRAGASRGSRAGASRGGLSAADEARTTEALAEAREAVRLQPAFPPAYRVLARTLAIRRDFGPAREAAQRALQLAPRSVPDLITLGDVERLAGQGRAARAAVRAALGEDPENPDALWLIALLDAERLRVGAAMSGLRGLAAGHPAELDATVMTWPIRGLLHGLCRGLKVGVLLAGLLAVSTIAWPSMLLLARAVAVTVAAVMILVTAWVLIPAGRLPWRCLGLLPARTRRLMAGGAVAATVSVGSLLAYALTARWPALVLSALAMVVLRALGRHEQG